MPNRFCDSHRPGERDPERLDCYELSVGGERFKCPYSEEDIQLRVVNTLYQLYIPASDKRNLPACLDFVPTPETNSRLIAKLSQKPNPQS